MKSTTKTSIVASLTILAGLIGFSFSYNSETTLETPAAVQGTGWLPDELPATQAWADAQPIFAIVDPDTGLPVAQANENADVRLWKSVATAAGTYPDEIAQQIGDCTSWGGKHAIQATQGSQIAGGQAATFHQVYPPWLYGAARVWILNGRIKGDGCTGAAVARAAQQFGVLMWDQPGLPTYSGDVARTWGRNGPPAELKAVAAANKVKTVSRLDDGEDGWNAIANGYGCTIASNFGTKTITPIDGRMVARWDGSWGHQMCADGVDGSTGKRWVHIQNSWGPKAHPAPIDDSPAGGFWISFADFDRIVKQGDSWAFSGFDGFPQQDLDLKIFGGAKP